jgi:hypothetical protein
MFKLRLLICGVVPSSLAFIVKRAMAEIGLVSIFSGSIVLIVYIVLLC